MSDRPQKTDWQALAREAIEEQDRQARALAAQAEDAVAPRLTPTALVALFAKCLFLMAVGYFLVNRYGIVHLVWLALVGWYLVVPTLTPTQRNVYR